MPLDRVSRTLLLLPSLLAAAACSSAPHPPAKQPDGSYDLSCRGRLTLCLRQAERVCGDKGYTVETARDIKQLLGHKQGVSQIGVERSEATIFCGTAEKEQPIRLRREEQQETELPSAPISPRLQACVPGATQVCVGPGGCNGGQVCASDGARFETCDCGSSLPAGAPVAPAAPPVPSP